MPTPLRPAPRIAAQRALLSLFALAAIAALPTPAGAATAGVTAFADGFERERVTTKLRAVGRPRIATGLAHTGRAALYLPRSRGIHYVERRLTRCSRLGVSLSYRRPRSGPQRLVELPANRIELVESARRLELRIAGRSLLRSRPVASRSRWVRTGVRVDRARRRADLFVGGRRVGAARIPGRARIETRVRVGGADNQFGPTRIDDLAVRLAPGCARPIAPGAATPPPAPAAAARGTVVGVTGRTWTVNGVPLYPGTRSQGVMQSARLVQAIWDDENPATVGNWRFPDGGPWDPERNVAGFIAALPGYRAQGLGAITISLQGGSPTREGLGPGTFAGTEQSPIASAFTPDGTFKPAWRARAERVIEAADANGLVVFLTMFYFGQAHRLADDAAVRRAAEGTVDWLKARGYANVVLEVANEAGSYDYGGHPILNVATGMPGLIRDLKARHPPLLTTTSHANTRGRIRQIPDGLLDAVDLILIHGNGESNEELRADVEHLLARYPGAVHVNEDTASAIDTERFEMLTGLGVGNGYYDQAGYQSPPADWGIGTGPKRTYFGLVRSLAP